MTRPELRDLPLKRFTVDDINRMMSLACLGDQDRVELVDGYLVAVPDPTARAAFARHELALKLEAAQLGAWVGQKRPVIAGTWDRPEADVLVVNQPHAAFADRHPTGADLVLVVEIADGTHAYKRTKAAAFALADAPVLWIVDLVNRRVEVYEGPRGAGWASVQFFDERDSVGLAGASWTVASLLG